MRQRDCGKQARRVAPEQQVAMPPCPVAHSLPCCSHMLQVALKVADIGHLAGTMQVHQRCAGGGGERIKVLVMRGGGGSRGTDSKDVDLL